MDWIHNKLDEQIECMHKELQALEEESKRMKDNDFRVSTETFERFQKARYYLLYSMKLAFELKNSAH